MKHYMIRADHIIDGHNVEFCVVVFTESPDRNDRPVHSIMGFKRCFCDECKRNNASWGMIQGFDPTFTQVLGLMVQKLATEETKAQPILPEYDSLFREILQKQMTYQTYRHVEAMLDEAQNERLAKIIGESQ